MIHSLITKVMNRETLSVAEAAIVMEGLYSGKISDSEASTLLSILRFRGETSEEIVGFVHVIRKYSKSVPSDSSQPLLDTCGTGGDGASTFNVSTAVSIILSSLGVQVAKHGNKAVTSKSGSSDCLEVLGIPLSKNSCEAIEQLKETNITFLHAPYFHPALKRVARIRQKLPFKTIFNLVGPLCNPMQPAYQLIGVSDEKSAQTMAKAIAMLGIKRAVLVSGKDGLDECSITTSTKIFVVDKGIISSFSYTPEHAGLSYGSMDEIVVKNKAESAGVLLDIMQGKSNQSSKDIVVLNAAAALFAADKVSTIREGVVIIKENLDSGRAYEQLLKLSKKEGLRANVN